MTDDAPDDPIDHDPVWREVDAVITVQARMDPRRRRGAHRSLPGIQMLTARVCCTLEMGR